MDGYAAAARAVLETAGDPPAVVLGVSWGGVIATRLALDAPDLVAGLVLVSSTVGSGVDRRRASAMAGRGDELRCLGPRRFAAQRAPRLVSPTAPPDLRHAVVRSMGDAIRVPGYVWAAEAMATTDHTDRLGEVRTPTLVVAGTADEVTGPPASERLAAGIPGARLELVSGAGHLVNQERPEALAQLLHDFLTDPTTAHGGPR
jgi:pimeloyl-ACP methyl ester carboxylesterase